MIKDSAKQAVRVKSPQSFLQFRVLHTVKPGGPQAQVPERSAFEKSSLRAWAEKLNSTPQEGQCMDTMSGQVGITEDGNSL